jgi:hypothetical protein
MYWENEFLSIFLCHLNQSVLLALILCLLDLALPINLMRFRQLLTICKLAF